VNHFGHFKLTMELLEIMKETSMKEEVRIIVLSAAAYYQGSAVINFEDINYKKESTYGYFYSYCQSKLANLLFAHQLSKKLKEEKFSITVNTVNPGIVKTDLFRNTDAVTSVGIDLMGVFLWKSIEQGAATTVYIATAKELNSKTGLYFEDCEETETTEYINDDISSKLWELTEIETNINYPTSKKELE
jgi:NAD(P)-dependent dehydrogenase (short-subunit alcohol dehydrogenase family)